MYAYDVITILKKFNNLGTEEDILPINHHMAEDEFTQWKEG